MDRTRSLSVRGEGIILGIVAALLLFSSPGEAEMSKDFTAATNDGSLITNDATGDFDFSGIDSVDAGQDASASGTSGTGGGGTAGRRDDSSCSCSVEQAPGPGMVTLVLLLLSFRRRTRSQRSSPGGQR